MIPKPVGLAGAAWGLGGVLFILGFAVYRLAPIALAAFEGPLRWHHWSALAASCAFMAYSEGYRGFQLGFSPRVAARALHLSRRPRLSRVLLAPVFCMSFFAAPLRRKVASYSLLVGIVILVQIVHRMPQPWRGILDTGVVIGLGWGILSLLAFALQAFTSEGFDHPAEVED